MVFSSIIFLLYFLPIFLLGYHLMPNPLKNIYLLMGSIFFYAWGAPLFIFVILATTCIDFFLVKKMSSFDEKRKRRIWLILSLSLNLGLLFYFKYCNFFIDNINHVLGAFNVDDINIGKILLPIGLSFYTFESITYVVDVYRGVHKPLRNFWDYQLYIILFPKLIAGPIVRYHQISDQIQDRSKNDTIDFKIAGITRFVLGLSKKVLIANVLGVTVNEIFKADADTLSSLDLWIGSIGYTFQIYFDFSGYTDMALGLGMILGFKFPENFNNPYISGSITEFWQRWHMTLGAWMKNYLYIPLGGNRVNSNGRLFFNLWLVFIFSGFWHGAKWSFLIWGLYHGTFLVLERLFLNKFYKRIGKFIPIAITFIVVTVGWVMFKMEDVPKALSMIKRMFTFDFTTHTLHIQNNHYNFVLILAAIFSFIPIWKIGQRTQNVFYTETVSVAKSLAFYGIITVLMVFCIASITGFGFNPFIYFRF
jgi:alginate O-acetyltransferase complex protein AlgI